MSTLCPKQYQTCLKHHIINQRYQKVAKWILLKVWSYVIVFDIELRQNTGLERPLFIEKPSYNIQETYSKHKSISHPKSFRQGSSKNLNNFMNPKTRPLLHQKMRQNRRKSVYIGDSFISRPFSSAYLSKMTIH